MLRKILKSAAFAPMLAFAAWMAVLATLPACGGTAMAQSEGGAQPMVIYRAMGENPRSIDPHKSGDTQSSLHCCMAYDCLLQYDYLQRPPELVPCLALSYDFDEKALVYTFKLRDDVYFHDDRCFHADAAGKKYKEEGDGPQALKGKGRKLVAADMVYSFKRLFALPDSGGSWVLEGFVKGLDSFRGAVLGKLDTGPTDDPDKPWRELLKSAEVEGLQAPDDHTFVVKLTQAYPQFLGAITLSYGAAVPWEASEYYGKDYFRKPVGTGAFVLTRWISNLELVWERNPTFRDEKFPTSDDPEDAVYKHLFGKRLPIADRIEYSIIKETQPTYLQFLKGELDVSGLDKDQFSSAISPQTDVTPALAKLGIQLKKWSSPTLDYVVFNMNDPVVGLQNAPPERAKAKEKARAIRRAVALSFDREDYIRRYLNGRGVPAAQMIPSGVGVWGHDPRFDMKSQRYDPAEGRRTLQEAGFRLEGAGEGPWRAFDPDTGKQVSVTISLRGNTERSKDKARYYRICGDKIGIQLVGEPLTFNEFLTRQDEGTGQMYDAGWVMDYPDAQNMLQLLYGPFGPPNVNSSSYANAEFDALYDKMKVLYEHKPEEKARKLELIGEMHKHIDRDVPWVLTNFQKTYALYNPWFLPPKPNDFAYSYGKFWYADMQVRTKGSVERSESNPVWGILIGLAFLIPAGLMVMRIVRQSR
ncbi:MAG: hypothetical protein IT462_08910 [Planctomycetes bacterium]|nr:hypothetical protein [Planctomycetota bacterium]